jgi:hypothetical protein
LLLTWLCTCALALQHNNGRDADFAVADQGLAIDDLVQVCCTTAEPTDLDVMATRIAQAACFEVLMQEDIDEVYCALLVIPDFGKCSSCLKMLGRWDS